MYCVWYFIAMVAAGSARKKVRFTEVADAGTQTTSQTVWSKVDYGTHPPPGLKAKAKLAPTQPNLPPPSSLRAAIA